MLARERVRWIPPVLERFETHGTGVEQEEPANEPLAEPNDFPDDFERHQRAQHACERTENAGLGASRNSARWRRFGEETAVGRVGRPVRIALVGADRRERAVEHADGGGDKGLFREETGIRHQVARGEIVRAIGHDVIAADERKRVSRDPRISTFTCGLRRWIAAAALSTLGSPISGVPWITCRCRFESATTSSSMMPSAPTPAAAR